MTRITTLAILAAAALPLALTPSPAAAQEAKRSYDIPAQPLPAAILRLSQQSGVVITAPGALVDGRTSAPIKGELTPRNALRAMLAGTGLEIEAGRSGSLTVVPKKAPGELQGNSASSLGPISGSLDTNDSNDNGEEILVTAQRRVERLIDVPISIVALSAEDLKLRRMRSLDDIAVATPGMSLQGDGTYQRRIAIRGISNTFGASSLIGVYLDEASVTLAPNLQPYLDTYDLERVEVLRGPQGTLYGEGSAGGTVRLITTSPNLKQFAFNANAAQTFTQGGASGQRVQSAINLPIVDDRLGLRVAATFDHGGGWIDNPAANRNDYNGNDLLNVRAKLRFKPTDALTIDAMAVVFRNNSSPGLGEDGNGDFKHVFNLDRTYAARDRHQIYNLTMTYDLGGARLLSTSTYAYKKLRVLDMQYVCCNAPPAPQFDVYFPSRLFRIKVATQELRLTSTDSAARFQWTVGTSYKDFKNNQAAEPLYFDVRQPVGSPLPAPFAVGGQSNRSKSWAVFGDASYELLAGFTLGGGVRQFWDDRTFVNGTTQAAKFKAFTPRVYGKYAFSKDFNVYASASKGFRSGGFNSQGFPAFRPEAVWTYELGTKMALARVLRAEVSLYYTNYSDYQVVGVLPPPAIPANITSNAGKARIKGVEASLEWRPLLGWTVSLNGNYNHSRFVKINASNSSYLPGDPLDLFAKYSFNVAVQRNLELADHDLELRVDYNQRGPSYFRNRSIGALYFGRSDVINTLNANAQFRWNDMLSFGLFAQNILNDRGYSDALSLEQNAARARPRSIGAEFGVTF